MERGPGTVDEDAERKKKRVDEITPIEQALRELCRRMEDIRSITIHCRVNREVQGPAREISATVWK